MWISCNCFLYLQILFFWALYSLKKIRFEEAEKYQLEFKSKISAARIGGNKSDKQLSAIENIMEFSKSPEEVITFYNDYFKMIHKVAYDAKHEKRLELLAPKKMLQRIPIALPQVT